MIQLGNQVRDIVTGFTGIAVSKVKYLNGCIQYCVKPPQSKEGAMPTGEYIDAQQLEYVSEGIAVTEKETGGLMSDTPKGIGLAK